MGSRIVAIVGRPNVGKSTLFNRITESRNAIVDEISGVTRDRNYGKGLWNGMEFSVIDTGGYVVNSDDVFEAEINKQVHLAIDEADVILFLVEVESGITDLDDAVAALLRKTKKEVILAVNVIFLECFSCHSKIKRVKKMAVNKEVTIPTINVVAKPFIGPEPNR